MSAKTKIVVLQMKEVIYTGIFVALGILLILLFIFMFLPKNKNVPEAQTTSKYVAGVYTSSVVFHDQALNVEVLVDNNHINSVRLVNLNETITTMYPLFQPVLEDINAQLVSTQSVDKITYSEDTRYTSQILIEAVKKALAKAEISVPQGIPQ